MKLAKCLNNMENILWTQGEDPLTPSSFVIDDKIYKYGESQITEEAFMLLENASEKLDITESRLNIIRKKARKYVSAAFNYASTDVGVYLQSCYLTKDKAGRNIPFRFLATKDKNIDHVLENLERYSRMIGRECNPYENTIFRRALKSCATGSKKSHKGRIIFFLIISVLVMVISIL